ncbi:DsbC family protein [Variovorax sp. OV329]|uniref:DsbC family protein n=1 Tax=Variovorax sp. OV329 TaxID=1882825 RepID=UPI0008DFCFE3|nr:DsbC family protein [Variovorax sp. OV329]SFM73551.1 thiol:disulfide interchange protein DsbC [Variovorax sp. OV329]
MKSIRLLAAALACAAAFVAATAHAGEAEIRKNLAARFPQFAQIEEVRKTPIAGLWEVRVNGSELFYADEQGDFLVQGEMIDVKGRRNLTQERMDKLNEVAFDKLPVQDAFKIVRGNGKRKLAVFEDPNCGYCKHFEKDLRNIDNVTVYLFLYPVLGPDSKVKSRNIWCSKDKAKAWNDWMVGEVKPTDATCDTAAIDRNVAFGRKYNITGTPTLIFSDGSRTPGAIPAAQVEKQLTAAAK